MEPIIFEMETSDPDDFMTLLWLADHPKVNLLGVMVTPGSRDQCQLVRWGLDHCGRKDVIVGSLRGPSWWDTEDGKKERVSKFHYTNYGHGVLNHEVGDVVGGPDTLGLSCILNSEITVVVGSAPKNIGSAFRRYPEIKLARWIQQGGFAGDNLVANPLEKFKGRITCPSFNPGGAPKETIELLASSRIARRLFVSKNVCHGVVWTPAMQAELKSRMTGRVGLQTMVGALDKYLAAKGVGKAMHDMVAAACALDESVCQFKEVEIYREKGEWGAREKAGTNTRISVGFDERKFIEVLAS